MWFWFKFIIESIKAFSLGILNQVNYRIYRSRNLGNYASLKLDKIIRFINSYLILQLLVLFFIFLSLAIILISLLFKIVVYYTLLLMALDISIWGEFWNKYSSTMTNNSKDLFFYYYEFYVNFVKIMCNFILYIICIKIVLCKIPYVLVEFLVIAISMLFKFIFYSFIWIIENVPQFFFKFTVGAILVYLKTWFKIFFIIYIQGFSTNIISISTLKLLNNYNFTVEFLYKYIEFQKVIFNYLNVVFYCVKNFIFPLMIRIDNGYFPLVIGFIIVFVSLFIKNNNLKVMVVLRHYWLYLTIWELIITFLVKRAKSINSTRVSDIYTYLSNYDQIISFNTLPAVTPMPLSSAIYVCDKQNLVVPTLSNELFYYFTVGNLFCILVAVIFTLCAYLMRNSADSITISCFLLLEFFLFKAFSTQNLLQFYIYFEAVLIPMVILLLRKGSSDRKIQAAYYLYMYTILMSLPMLSSILYNGFIYGTYDIVVLKYIINLNSIHTVILWWSLFIAFAVKIPIMPVHLWLPEAHVEASTETSIVLASLLLKLGIYGLVCLLIPMLPQHSNYFSPLVNTLALVSLLYASLFAITQTDLKKIIAYTSIAHMNFVVLCIFTLSEQGLIAAIYMSFTHGIVSAGLFLLIGALYDRHHTRNILYYGGLARVNPVFSTFLFIFSISNMSHPGTSSFVGEILGIFSIFESNVFLGIAVAASTVLSCIYSMSLFSKLCFGELNEVYIHKFIDLNITEFIVLLILTIINITLGVYPSLLLDPLTVSIICT